MREIEYLYFQGIQFGKDDLNGRNVSILFLIRVDESIMMITVTHH